MKLSIKLIHFILLLVAFASYTGCKNHNKPAEKEIVKNPEEIDEQVADNLRSVLQYAEGNNGKIDDSNNLALTNIVSAFYDNNGYHNLWSKKGNWLPIADSMIDFIEHSRYYGLYPDDYHFKKMVALRKKFREDSLAKKDVVFWTKADLLLSDAFLKTIKDLKEGRLLPDSVSIINNKKSIDSLFIKGLKKATDENSLISIFNSTEPLNANYQSLRETMKNFVDSMDTATYTYIAYPLKDSLRVIKKMQKRLSEAGVATNNILLPDSLTLNNEIKQFQQAHALKVDGKISARLVKKLNNTDAEKFKRIAVTLDRYKRMPALPSYYIWVNLPGYYLKVIAHDSVALESRVIVGKPETRTPLLNSSISDMVIYPQWTIPESIIKKDILPALKKDPGYLQRKGFSLIDIKGDSVDPYTVNWQKYSIGIPWKVRQGSGDDNALGIFKFNFSNPYNVYLHDTNQRYLFKNSSRALSHGCVRVQNWQGLAYLLARNDSKNLAAGQKLLYNEDSIKTWIANKNRKQIMLKSKFPLYIKYFTCEAKNGKLIFYDDIYNEDKMYAEKYFANK
ncbi:MAG: L,D-transpeptidase family protein [Ginsengibacter sp.]